jgi:hypothetical protein
MHLSLRDQQKFKLKKIDNIARNLNSTTSIETFKNPYGIGVMFDQQINEASSAQQRGKRKREYGEKRD